MNLTLLGWRKTIINSFCNNTDKSVLNLGLNNTIITANLIYILKDISIYKEVYKILKSRPKLLRNLFGNDLQTGKELLEGYRPNYIYIRKIFEELIENIENWNYSPNPVMAKPLKGTTNINEEKGGRSHKLKPFFTPSLKDFVLQTAIKILIEPKCEKKIFNSQSYGFRPNRSLHDALRSVKEMEGITWMIEGKINCFDNIDYNILINIINNKLKPDRTLMVLIHKLLKAGYLLNPSTCEHIATSLPLAQSRIEAWQQALNKGDILSPLLYNLYLTPLDDFIDNLKKNFEQFPEIKVYYVRYLDTWVIGVLGPSHIANKIKEEINKFLEEELKLGYPIGADPDTDGFTSPRWGSKIVYLGIDFGKVLGHYVKGPTQGQSKTKRQVTPLKSSPLFLIPLNEITFKLVNRGFAED